MVGKKVHIYMKKLLQMSALSLFVMLGAFLIINFTPTLASAEEGENNSTEATPTQTSDESTENKSPYSYTAQPGDSYTKIARKAVQTYGINNNVSLSQAQIVAAETFLTIEAGSPKLSVGESVTLSEDAVKGAVEKAKGLDEAAQSRWQKYVPYVDFNTNNVGQSS